MPKESTHLYLAGLAADWVQQSLPSLSGILNDAPNMFMLGSVAPDSIFNYLCGPAKEAFRLNRKYSHDSESHNLFGFLNRFAGAGLSFTPALSFAAGIICHLAADMIFHPLIIYFTGIDAPGRKEAMIRHFRFESGLDHELRRLHPELKHNRLRNYHRKKELADEDFAAALEALHIPEEDAGLIPGRHFLSMYRQHAVHESLYGRLPAYIAARKLNILSGGQRAELPALFYLDSRGPASDEERSLFENTAVSYKNPASGAEMRKSFIGLVSDFRNLLFEYLRPLNSMLSGSGSDWRAVSPVFGGLLPRNPDTGLPSASGTDSLHQSVSFFELKTFDEVWK